MCFTPQAGNGGNDIMEEYGMNNNNNSDGHEMKQHFQRFAKQLSDWYCDGKTPGLASQDTRFTLELQKQKLQSLGLDMQIQFRNPDADAPHLGNFPSLMALMYWLQLAEPL